MLAIFETYADVLRIATFQGDPHLLTGRRRAVAPRQAEAPQRMRPCRRMRTG